MGAADIIPGVSGGTVALIVGIYSRLISAISQIDSTFIRLLSARQWIGALKHIDFRFLTCLAAGIGIGAVAFGASIEGLLVSPLSRAVTLSVFMGMILASITIVAGLIKSGRNGSTFGCILLAALGAGFAFWITGLEQLSAATSLPYIFFCGVIGICAMILPGISGAYLLIIMGFYPQLTDILHRLKDLDVHVDDLIIVGVFAIGCLVGLIAFSKLLRWLLSHHINYTMAVLAGFMLGALRKVWPFQADTTPDEVKLKHKVFEPFLPERWDETTMLCLAAAITAFFAVIAIDRIARRNRHVL